MKRRLKREPAQKCGSSVVVKAIEVVIGREPARPEERFEVEQRHVGLRDQIVVRVRRAGDPTVRRHVLDEQQHRSADHKRRDNLHDPRCSRVLVLSSEQQPNRSRTDTGKIAAVGLARIAIAAGITYR